MLAYLNNGTWVEWIGEQRPLDDTESLYSLPSNAEMVYQDTDLLRFGLYRVVVTPAGTGNIIGRTITGDIPNPILTYTVEPYGIDILKQQLLNQLLIIADNKLNTGAPVTFGETVLHVDIANDSTRQDLTAMATTALGSQLSSSVPWPDSYKLGWITSENVRIPLETPEDGLILASRVDDYRAKIIQRRRTLKDLIAVATTQADLDAIEINAGWPE